MGQNEHIYFTRSKMNTLQRTYTRDDSELGITKPIKVYNLKTKTYALKNEKSKKRKQKKSKLKSKKSKGKKNKTNTNTKKKSKNINDIVNKKPDIAKSSDIFVMGDETSHIRSALGGSTHRQYRSLQPSYFSLQNLFTKINKASNDVESEEDTNDIKVKIKKNKNIYKKKEEKLFYNSLSEEDKELYNSYEKTLKEYRSTTIPLRFKILKLNIPMYTKNYIIEKIDQFNKLETADNEYHKLNTWLHNLIKIPFNTYVHPDIQHSSSSEYIANYLKDAQTILEKEVYGHKEAKEQIIEIIASQITNPKLLGVAIGIQGPPGNGKTTLIKNGISKALKRPFRLIGLGGNSNSDFLIGHDYTYEGSVPGKIVQILQETKCMNPIIYFDELDKVSDTPKGQEIINLLCHLVDTSQNQHFADKYFSGIDLDMSRALFVFSYNDESKISPILLDRFIKIKTNKFNKEDKVTIANDYLLPKICKNINFDSSNISFTNDCLEYIITNHTKKEKGVRNLKRFLEKIVSRVNIVNLLKDYSGNIKDIIPYAIDNFTLPIVIDTDIKDTLITTNKDDEDMDPSIFGLYT